MNGAEPRNLFTGCEGEGTGRVDGVTPRDVISCFNASSAAMVSRVFCEVDCVCKESEGRQSFWTPESNGSGVTKFSGAGVEFPAEMKRGRGGLGVLRGSHRPEAYATIKVAQSQSDWLAAGEPSILGEGASSSTSRLKGEGNVPKSR